MTTLGEKLSDEEVEQVPHSQYPMRTVKISLFLMKHINLFPQLFAGHEDSHGNINYEEFVRTVMNG